MGYSLIRRRSPNVSARVGKPIYLVTHHMEGGFDGSVSWLCNPAAQASCDECISKDGRRVAVLVSDLGMKSWEVGNANSLCYGFESEGHVGDHYPRAFYDTLADRMVRVRGRIRRRYGVTIPLRFSTHKGQSGIVSHKLVAQWYGGSDHTDGELDRQALAAAIARRTRPVARLAANAKYVWANWIVTAPKNRGPEPPRPARIPRTWWAAVRWMQAQRERARRKRAGQ